MLGAALTLALASTLAASLPGPPGGPLSAPPAGVPAPEGLLALDPHITIGDCPGGVAVDLAPGMQQRTLEGSLRGDVSGEVIFGQYCVGFYTEPAQVCVHVSGAAAYYTFEITEAQSVDTTLAISGPGLEYPYCDDDGAGRALLSKAVIWLEPGAYLVWVGSYGQGTSARYTMTIRGGEHW